MVRPRTVSQACLTFGLRQRHSAHRREPQRTRLDAMGRDLGRSVSRPKCGQQRVKWAAAAIYGNMDPSRVLAECESVDFEVHTRL